MGGGDRTPPKPKTTPIIMSSREVKTPTHETINHDIQQSEVDPRARGAGPQTHIALTKINVSNCTEQQEQMDLSCSVIDDVYLL